MQLHRVVAYLDDRDASVHYAPPFVIFAVSFVLEPLAVSELEYVSVVVIDLTVAVLVYADLALVVAIHVVAIVELHVLELLLPLDTVVGEDEWGLELLAGAANHACSPVDELTGSHRVLVDRHTRE